MKTRRDAWTPKDDRLLAETVIRHIREGSTQLKAFDETGDILNRTSAACGFRWNAEVRYQYEDALHQAKKDRKVRKKRSSKQEPTSHTVIIDAEFSEETSQIPTLSMQDVISYLQKAKLNLRDSSDLLTENEELKRKREQIIKVHDNLKNKLNIVTKHQTNLKEDFESLVRVMDRARNLVMKEETFSDVAPIFHVDQNGNIEIIS